MKSVWKVGVKIISLLVILAAPLLIDKHSLRIISGLVVYSIVVTVCFSLIKKHENILNQKYEADRKQYVTEKEAFINTIETPLYEKSQLIPALVNQLEEVSQETETAALDIGGRFMSIVERARRNTEDASEVLKKLAGDSEDSGVNRVKMSKKALPEVV